MTRLALAATALLAASLASPVAAQEAFVGVLAHEVETPLTFAVEEEGVDIQLGYRFARQEALDFLGKPQPYLLASINTAGDTSFVGAGLAWRIEAGRVYVRPGLGMVVHDGPKTRTSPITGKRTDLGSRVLFEPELSVGIALSPRISAEATWVHISHAQIFNTEQNPGIDMMGVRLNFAL